MTIVTVYAPGNADMFDSYGLIACELIRHLDKAGIYANLMTLGSQQHASQTAELAALTSRPVRPSLGGIMLGWPTTYAKHDSPLAQHGRRVAVTMFESSKLPKGWTDILNEMDAVIVPSTFCRDVFAACGVNVPIHVIPLGISETFQPHWREYGPRVRGDKPFTFLAIGDRGKRKNPDAALQAFLLAFDDNEDYRLVIKTRDPKDNPHIIFTNPNIDMISADMTEQELYQLYCDCDCFVFPSLGEGFGLPPREAAATGMPVIATNWSGLTDDIGVWGIPLDYQLVTADWQGSRDLEGQDLGLWAEPDIEHLADLMHCVADHSQAYRIRAHHAAIRVHGLYSWHHFATAVYDIWRGNNGNTG